MKKIALFAAALMLCGGIAMAQAPVKKSEKKAQTEQTQAAKPETQATQKSHCGNCPHHRQAATKSNEAAANVDKNKNAEKPCCNKGTEKKACNHNNEACKNKEAEKAAATK